MGEEAEVRFGRTAAAIVVTFLVMFFVPLLPYGAMSALTGIQPPGGDDAGRFMLGVVVMKIGVATGFVLVFVLGGAG